MMPPRACRTRTEPAARRALFCARQPIGPAPARPGGPADRSRCPVSLGTRFAVSPGGSLWSPEQAVSRVGHRAVSAPEIVRAELAPSPPELRPATMVARIDTAGAGGVTGRDV